MKFQHRIFNGINILQLKFTFQKAITSFHRCLPICSLKKKNLKIKQCFEMFLNYATFKTRLYLQSFCNKEAIIRNNGFLKHFF